MSNIWTLQTQNEWEKRWNESYPKALYIHIPFCKQKCAYCNFASFACAEEDPTIEAYLTGLTQQLSELADARMLTSIRTAYIGGGTPSMLGSKLTELVTLIHAYCPKLEEFTSEANPESLGDELISELKEAGLTRLSIGVQSTQVEELAYLGRIHNAETAIKALESAVRSGLDVSCDLMCGIPLQSAESWQESLGDVLATGVSHVSVYPLQLEEGTLFWKLCEEGLQAWPDEDASADRMLEAEELLSKQGFKRYEVASYAQAGKQCQHNLAYWSGVTYLGLGTSAASMLSIEAYEHLRKVIPSLPAVKSDTQRVRITCASTPHEIAQAHTLSQAAFECEYLGARETAAEDLMLAARTARGISPALIGAARGHIGDMLDASLVRLQEDGLLERRLDDTGQGEFLAPTQTGWLRGNELYAALWDLAG